MKTCKWGDIEIGGVALDGPHIRGAQKYWLLMVKDQDGSKFCLQSVTELSYPQYSKMIRLLEA